jgi:hypothetical protein
VSTPEPKPFPPWKHFIVTKDVCAKSQLENAIILWFHHADPISIHTLAVAAQDCYHAIGAHKGSPSALQGWIERQSKGFQERIRYAQNFFKHGKKDLLGKAYLYPTHTEMLLLDSIGCHENNAPNTETPLMRLWVGRFALEHPGAAPKLEAFHRIKIEDFKNTTRLEFFNELLPALSAK